MSASLRNRLKQRAEGVRPVRPVERTPYARAIEKNPHFHFAEHREALMEPWDIDKLRENIVARTTDDLTRGGSAFTPGAIRKGMPMATYEGRRR